MFQWNRKFLIWLICDILFIYSSNAAEVNYTNQRLYHVRHTGCTYNRNITTMTHLELNVPLPESWPDCNVSNVKISGDAPFLLHNTEGPGQIYRTVYKNGLPKKDTTALVCVEYDIQLFEVNINFDELSKCSYPEYIRNAEYEYYTRPSVDRIAADDPQIQRILKLLKKKSNGHPVLYAKAVYDWIAENIKYANPRPAADLGICLKERKGDCGAIADFFVDFCRYGGVPARFVAGCWAGGFDGWHCWAEFQLPTGVWVPVDHSPAGGFGHLSNNHLPLVKAGAMKFDVNENKGSKDCGFVQIGYWLFFFGSGSEGDRIETEFSVESFGYSDMPNISGQDGVQKALQEANMCFNKKNYDRALQIYRYLVLSQQGQTRKTSLYHYKMAKCFLRKKQQVKAMLELLPLVDELQGTEIGKDAESLLLAIRK